MMKKLSAAFLGLLFSAGAAFGQATVPAGGVMGNATAAERTARAETMTAILDRAFGSTRGSILRRGASGWAIVVPSATVGLPWVSAGTGADPLYQLLGIAGGGTNCSAASGTCLDNITGFASTGYIKRTGAGAYSFQAAPFPIADGGTNGTSQQTALNNLMCTPSGAGSLVYYNGTNWVCLAGNTTSTKVLQEDASGVPSWVAAGAGTVTSVAAGTGMSFTTITTTGSVAIDKSTAANLEAGTSNKVLTSDIIYDAAVNLGTTVSGSVTWDFSTFLNATTTLTGNVTALTCSNMKASQSGVIQISQDGTGGRTMVAAWCSNFRWAGGTRGVLSTAINSIDALFYQCISTTVCYVSLGKAQAN